MLLGSTRYYRLVGGRLVGMRDFDRSTGAPGKSKVHPDEVAVWRCENWDGRHEVVMGDRVREHCRRNGISLDDMLFNEMRRRSGM